MPERTSYEHGTPSWVDLATEDATASRRFYGELFGWEFEELPTGQEGVTYTMARLRGKDVAALAPPPPGRPPSWGTYVTVDDVDATMARVAPAGGTPFGEPFDVLDAGRMGILADPAAATIYVWKAKNQIGAELVNEHGTLTWNELMTPDVAGAVTFYGDVFGWGTQVMSSPEFGDYTMFTLAGTDKGVAGAMNPPAEGIPPHWGVYFSVDDCDAAAEKVKALGGSVLAEPFDAPDTGRIAAVTDSQGVPFSVITNAQPTE